MSMPYKNKLKISRKNSSMWSKNSHKAVATRGTNFVICGMAKASFTIRTVVYMTVVGAITKWTVLDRFITSQESWHIKACGSKINFKAKENCTTRLQ